MTNDEYLADVFEKLNNGPTAQDIDYLIEAYARVGYLAANAEGDAEHAESVRKYEEANAYLAAKKSGEKVTERQAEAEASLAIKPYRDAEAEAWTKARKLKNLMLAVEQAINGVKFLSRSAG